MSNENDCSGLCRDHMSAIVRELGALHANLRISYWEYAEGLRELSYCPKEYDRTGACLVCVVHKSAKIKSKKEKHMEAF